MNIKINVAVILLSVFSSYVHADSQSPRLEGDYRVQGDCAYRAKNGDYKSCLVWNKLAIKKPDASNQYAFELDTNTFSTTQGGCYVAGKLRFQTVQGVARLVRSDPTEDGCLFSFKVTPRQLILDVPDEEFQNCIRLCGTNSSLYSKPFPRTSRVNK